MPGKPLTRIVDPDERPLSPRALVENEAATYTGFSPAFLRAARIGRCDGPPFIRVGRAVRYLVDDLDQWLESRRVRTRR